MGRRRYVPPDAQRVAARFGVEPASEEAGKRAYFLARALGIANDIRPWHGDEQWHDRGDGWTELSIGLSDDEKLRWRLIAAASEARP